MTDMDSQPHLTRRELLRRGTVLAGASGIALAAAGRRGGSALADAPGGASLLAAEDRSRKTKPHAPAIGFVLTSEQFTGPQLVDLGVAAEDAGFDAVWTSDHFLPWQDNQGHVGQAWILLGALAQRTKHIRIGTGVTCPIYRYHPAIVAQTFAALSYYAPGRLFLGCGKGEALNEQAATGTWDKHPVRAERWVEAIQLIRKLWTGDWVKHQGKYYRVDAKLYDKPTAPIPLYLAAAGTKSTRIAGEHGDGWITDAKDALTPKKRDAFAAGVKASKREQSAVPIIAEHWVVVGGKPEAEEAASQWHMVPKGFTKYFHDPDPRHIQHEAEREIPLESVYADWAVSEDPDVHLKAIQKLLDGGVQQVFIHSGQKDQRRVIELYGSRVLPRIKAVAAVESS
jgi:F420-dependent hydroxymycolic acid dehydrogenase